MPAVKYDLINAFVRSSDPSASGNPAAVILLPTPATSPSIPPSADSLRALFPSDERLHNTATELAQPMTSYLVPLAPSTFALRWFSAGGEAPMCGHGTVAAAHYLFEQGHKSPLKLYTPKAEVGADKVDGGVRIQLPHTTQFEPAPSDVLEVTNTIFNGGQVKPSDVKVAGVYLMVELESKVDLQALQIDTETLGKSKLDAKNLRIFQLAPSSDDPSAPQVQSRVINFYPGGQFVEDDATGSAHAAIVPLLLNTRLDPLTSAHPSLQSQSPIRSLRVRQRSARGGEMVATWDDAAGVVKLDAKTEPVKQGEVEL